MPFVTCQACGGTGEKNDQMCVPCQGSGTRWYDSGNGCQGGCANEERVVSRTAG